MILKRERPIFVVVVVVVVVVFFFFQLFAAKSNLAVRSKPSSV